MLDDLVLVPKDSLLFLPSQPSELCFIVRITSYNVCYTKLLRFGFGLVKPDSISRTLSARYYKDGSEILVYQGKKKNPRRLTPRECARLMGYDDSFIIPVSDTRAYKQFGNSVVVPLFTAIADALLPYIKK